MFEGELAEARRLLDEVSKEKAQLQIEATSYQEKYEAERARSVAKYNCYQYLVIGGLHISYLV